MTRNVNTVIQNSEFHDVMEKPWKSSFILLMRQKSLQTLFTQNKDNFTPFIIQNYPLIAELTLLDAFRLQKVTDLLESVKNTEGDIVECGCFKGGNAILMALWLKENNIKKKIYLFDSFEGLPDPNQNHDSGYRAGQFTASFEELNNKILSMGLSSYFEIHKGWFTNTVKPFIKQHPSFKISLLHIDCDLYESTRDCFPDFYPYVEDGGVCIFDDFNDGGKGEKKAVLEVLNSESDICFGPAPQAFVFNRKSNNSVVKDGEFKYSFKDILSNEAYLNWLNNVCHYNFKENLKPYLTA